MKTFHDCTAEELINGLKALEGLASNWAKLPVLPKPDYGKIEDWLLNKVATIEPPQIQSYQDNTWCDLRSTLSWNENIPLVAIIASAAIAAALRIAIAFVT